VRCCSEQVRSSLRAVIRHAVEPEL
jgi:hypothetical protein